MRWTSPRRGHFGEEHDRSDRKELHPTLGLDLADDDLNQECEASGVELFVARRAGAAASWPQRKVIGDIDEEVMWGLWCKFEVPWRPCESFQQLLVGGRTASVSEGHCSSDSVSMLSICACMRRDWGPACRREDSAVSVIALLLRIVVLFPLISACRAATLCTRDTINMNLLPLHSFSARHTAHCHVKAQAYERMNHNHNTINLGMKETIWRKQRGACARFVP